MAKYPKRRVMPDVYSRLPFGSWAGLSVKIFMASRDGWVQRPITREPNPCLYTQLTCLPTSTAGCDTSVVASEQLNSWRWDRARLEAHNSAYSKMYAKVQEASASLGMSLLDAGKTLDSITAIALRLVRALTYFRQGNLVATLDVLGNYGYPDTNVLRYRGKNRWWNARKRAYVQSSTLWLELNFGWAPLLQDLHDAGAVLQSTPRDVKVSGKGFAKVASYKKSTGDQSYPEATISGHVKVHMGCYVRVTNRNAILWRDLGLANPASVVWDAIPWSFVIDWGFTFGKYLASLDDWIGFEQIYPFKSEVLMGTDVVPGGLYRSEYTKNSASLRWERSCNPLKFRFNAYPRSNIGSGIWKAVTSVALVVQKLQKLL